MFAFILFIILPASSLAVCADEDKTVRVILEALDVDRDDNIDREETNAAFNIMDANGDQRITVEEAKEREDLLAPILKGHEEDLLAFLDADGDGVLTKDDVDGNFARIDLNNDGVKSKSEYKRFLQKYCRIHKPRL